MSFFGRQPFDDDVVEFGLVSDGDLVKVQGRNLNVSQVPIFRNENLKILKLLLHSTVAWSRATSSTVKCELLVHLVF